MLSLLEIEDNESNDATAVAKLVLRETVNHRVFMFVFCRANIIVATQQKDDALREAAEAKAKVCFI